MEKKQYRLLFSAACLGMLLFGITITMVGSILPEIIPRYGISKTEAGSLLFILNVGILLGAFIFGPVVDRYGYKLLLIVCALIILAGLQGVAFAPTFRVLTLFILLFGIGGGIMNGATNALVSDISGDKRSEGLTFLGAFFGLGAFGVPMMLGVLLDSVSYSIIVASMGSIVLVAILLFLYVEFPPSKNPHSFPIKKALNLVKDPMLLLLSLLLFFQSGMESITGGFAAAYFNEVLMVDSSKSVFALSFFWMGMMIARIVTSKLLKKWPPTGVLKTSIGITLTGVLLLLFSTNVQLATLGVFIMGTGFGACFPLILGYVGSLYPDMSGTAFSIALIISLGGGASMPYTAGVVGDLFGLQAAFLLVPTLLVMFVIFLVLAMKRLNIQYGHIDRVK